MAGVLSTTSCTYRCRYHAFLSFRGEDTRKGFSDHLYRALELAGIHTFRDDEEIERGANIAAELHKAIQESRVAIVVFSSDYASSSWCLNELAKIMERQINDGYMVVPVFYKVDPSVVRWQSGCFAEAFVKHEERFKAEMDKVTKWRKALKAAADLRGVVLGDQYESQVIQNIVDDIEKKMDPVTLNVAPYAVGINDRVEDLNMWLRDGSVDVGVAGIYGMGGIGKTTIAKAAYNLNQHSFEGRSFLADVRATTEQPDGLVRLQRNLLSDIQRRRAKKINNVAEGTSKIKDVVRCKRVLIVLDDVNDLDQLNAIFGMREWFLPGSKIIITTRDKHLLTANGVSKMFMVPELDEDESLQLFSWHAFRQAHPIEGFMEVSALVVKHCGGLPLALQVLGSSLFGKSLLVWYDTLERLDEVPDGKIQRILRISYDYLQDDRDKTLFLHIACFFIGKKRNLTVTVLHHLKLFATSGVQNLVDRCLLKIDDDKLMMHQLIRDMGRGIVREESVDDPGKRSRVVQKDAYEILKNSSGTETIKGLLLNFSMLMDGMSSTAILKDNNKRWHAEESDGTFSRRRRLSFFSWESINYSSHNLASTSSVADFKTEAFKRMTNLQLLQLNNVKVNGGYREFPKALLWLSWKGFPMKSMPADFCLKNLVALELKHSILQLVWKGIKFVPGLKILDLSHSHGLVRTPDFSGLPTLERLILKDCINIVEIDESIGELQELVFLNLKDCKNLMKLPRRISMLTSLHELILSGCSKLGDTVKLGPSSNKPWLSICSWVSPRKSLEATSSFSLAHLPTSLGSLSLAGCNLSKIADDLSVLSSLKYLDVSGNPIVCLPENLKSLTMLESLSVNDCTKLKMLPELPPSLKNLQAEVCTSLRKVTNLPNFFMSLTPFLTDCGELAEVQSLFTIKPLRGIDLQMIKNMGLCNLESIRGIEVEMGNHLTYTSRTGPLQGLYECGIFSIFLHAHTIPDQYIYRNLGSSVLSIIVPSDPKLKIRGLNVCVLYALGLYRSYAGSQILKVSNETKGLMWTYCPVTQGVPKEDGLMLWLSHWLFENNELEGGDEIRVSVHSAAAFIHFPEGQDSLPAKEFGIQLVYDQENEGVPSNGQEIALQDEVPCWSHNVITGSVSLSAYMYQMWPGKYFICNNVNYMCHGHFRSCKENPSHLDFSYEPKDRVSEYCHHLFKHAIFSQEKIEYISSKNDTLSV
ncbi:hypothetical protein ACLB2K_010845 [Fragaria x ananassa]